MLVSELVSLLSTMPQTHEVAMLINNDSLYRLVDNVVIANNLSLVVLEDRSLLINMLNHSKDKRRKELNS